MQQADALLRVPRERCQPYWLSKRLETFVATTTRCGADLMQSKRKPGRPTLHGKPGVRYQVHLPPQFANYLRKRGDGSISQGICRLILAQQSKSITIPCSAGMHELNFAMDLLAFLWSRDYEYRLEHPPAWRSLHCYHLYAPTRLKPWPKRCVRHGKYVAPDGKLYCRQHAPEGSKERSDEGAAL